MPAIVGKKKSVRNLAAFISNPCVEWWRETSVPQNFLVLASCSVQRWTCHGELLYSALVVSFVIDSPPALVYFLVSYDRYPIVFYDRKK